MLFISCFMIYILGSIDIQTEGIELNRHFLILTGSVTVCIIFLLALPSRVLQAVQQSVSSSSWLYPVEYPRQYHSLYRLPLGFTLWSIPGSTTVCIVFLLALPCGVFQAVPQSVSSSSWLYPVEYSRQYHSLYYLPLGFTSWSIPGSTTVCIIFLLALPCGVFQAVPQSVSSSSWLYPVEYCRQYHSLYRLPLGFTLWSIPGSTTVCIVFLLALPCGVFQAVPQSVSSSSWLYLMEYSRQYHSLYHLPLGFTLWSIPGSTTVCIVFLLALPCGVLQAVPQSVSSSSWLYPVEYSRQYHSLYHLPLGFTLWSIPGSTTVCIVFLLALPLEYSRQYHSLYRLPLGFTLWSIPGSTTVCIIFLLALPCGVFQAVPQSVSSSSWLYPVEYSRQYHSLYHLPLGFTLWSIPGSTTVCIVFLLALPCGVFQAVPQSVSSSSWLYPVEYSRQYHSLYRLPLGFTLWSIPGSTTVCIVFLLALPCGVFQAVPQSVSSSSWLYPVEYSRQYHSLYHLPLGFTLWSGVFQAVPPCGVFQAPVPQSVSSSSWLYPVEYSRQYHSLYHLPLGFTLWSIAGSTTVCIIFLLALPCGVFQAVPQSVSSSSWLYPVEYSRQYHSLYHLPLGFTLWSIAGRTTVCIIFLLALPCGVFQASTTVCIIFLLALPCGVFQAVPQSVSSSSWLYPVEYCRQYHSLYHLPLGFTLWSIPGSTTVCIIFLLALPCGVFQAVPQSVSSSSWFYLTLWSIPGSTTVCIVFLLALPCGVLQAVPQSVSSSSWLYPVEYSRQYHSLYRLPLGFTLWSIAGSTTVCIIFLLALPCGVFQAVPQSVLSSSWLYPVEYSRQYHSLYRLPLGFTSRSIPGSTTVCIVFLLALLCGVFQAVPQSVSSSSWLYLMEYSRQYHSLYRLPLGFTLWSIPGSTTVCIVFLLALPCGVFQAVPQSVSSSSWLYPVEAICVTNTSYQSEAGGESLPACMINHCWPPTRTWSL